MIESREPSKPFQRQRSPLTPKRLFLRCEREGNCAHESGDLRNTFAILRTEKCKLHALLVLRCPRVIPAIDIAGSRVPIENSELLKRRHG